MKPDSLHHYSHSKPVGDLRGYPCGPKTSPQSPCSLRPNSALKSPVTTRMAVPGACPNLSTTCLRSSRLSPTDASEVGAYIPTTNKPRFQPWRPREIPATRESLPNEDALVQNCPPPNCHHLYHLEVSANATRPVHKTIHVCTGFRYSLIP